MDVKITPRFLKSLKQIGSFKEKYLEVIYWIKTHFRKESFGILAAWFKGWPYDSYYLLKLEQSKLKEMIAYSERNMRYVGQEYDIRDMKICVSLIDIITETRDLFTFDGNLEFSEPDEFGNCTINTDKLKYRCFVNVNERNAYRFSNENRKYHYKHDLYIMKARQLYYQIRIEKEERWGV